MHSYIYDGLDDFFDITSSDGFDKALQDIKYPIINKNFLSITILGDWELFEHIVTKERNWLKISDIMIRGIEDCFYDPIYSKILHPPV